MEARKLESAEWNKIFSTETKYKPELKQLIPQENLFKVRQVM